MTLGGSMIGPSIELIFTCTGGKVPEVDMIPGMTNASWNMTSNGWPDVASHLIFLDHMHV
jgi:hypothetical protein